MARSGETSSVLIVDDNYGDDTHDQRPLKKTETTKKVVAISKSFLVWLKTRNFYGKVFRQCWLSLLTHPSHFVGTSLFRPFKVGFHLGPRF